MSNNGNGNVCTYSNSRNEIKILFTIIVAMVVLQSFYIFI